MFNSLTIYIIMGLASIIALLYMSDKSISIGTYVPFKDILSRLIIPIVIALLAMIVFLKDLKNKEKYESTALDARIHEINIIQSTLKDLNNYLVNQKNDMIETNNTLIDLKKEKAFMDSLSTIDKSSITRILTYQNMVNRKNKWKEYIITFVLGVATSIIAQYLISLYKRYT